MKTARYFIIAMAFLALVSCKKEKTDDGVVEEKSLELVPNKSDVKFAEALKLMENEQQSEAAKNIKEGVAELDKEAKNLSGKAKERLDTYTVQLNKYASELEKGNDVQINKVRKLIANAEIIVNHSYLGSDEIFALDGPQFSELDSTPKRLNTVLADLKKAESNIKADAKKDNEALVAEGKKLKTEYEAWQNRTFEFNKKANEHFKRHYPKYSFDK